MRFRIRHLLILIGLAAVIFLAIRSHRDQVAKPGLIPRGMRAFTIRVLNPNAATGEASSVLPGNKVDVLLTDSGGDLNHVNGATTLIQNVEILAVDQKIETPAENKVDLNEMGSVTLLVTPQQAKQLVLAQNKGLLHLAPTKVQPHGTPNK
jgi:pilus assembly protein CpaB